MPFCIENQGQNLQKSPWLWSSILQTFEGIYAYNIDKKNRIRFPLDFVALFGQVSIWKSYFERCPIARHKWYLFTLAKIDMVKYCYVLQMLKKCHRLFETNCPLNSLCALAMFISYFCQRSEINIDGGIQMAKKFHSQREKITFEDGNFLPNPILQE